MSDYFTYDQRLKIKVPQLTKSWTAYNLQTQNKILTEWERIRGSIPDRIGELEAEINNKQEALNIEEDFNRSCELNHEISELASIINDLWIWFRTTQRISNAKIHN
ncbi:hypothetical protein [Metabacillus halosaccharovorans]|uniref:DUF5082 domain-containing protein n=1 Tax=Metabacillus halosaccharovorans TaxID=930124 RepID=A0ABT3DPM2_9BACI|nr:hypothetical protein [Metabacillus halosaccharovorans]MCV9888849.1 hypothetical protein [Metabacillus halosaccharovorans]